MPQWPAFEVDTKVKDWRDYDRLVVDITNTGGQRHMLSVFISDSRVPFRQGLAFRFALPARGYRRFTIRLSAFPETWRRLYCRKQKK